MYLPITDTPVGIAVPAMSIGETSPPLAFPHENRRRMAGQHAAISMADKQHADFSVAVMSDADANEPLRLAIDYGFVSAWNAGHASARQIRHDILIRRDGIAASRAASSPAAEMPRKSFPLAGQRSHFRGIRNETCALIILR